MRERRHKKSGGYKLFKKCLKWKFLDFGKKFKY